MKTLPEVLASRAVHQYRRRDALTYVGLRQHLRNRSALRDQWSDEVATSLVLERQQGNYHTVKFFKEVGVTGEVAFRTLSIPSPHEALAETALLAACADHGKAFTPSPAVFSYRLCAKAETEGVFRPYFRGFTERHEAIAAACALHPDGVVVYLDIRKFYPSITYAVAFRAWTEACELSALPRAQRQLGEKLLADYEQHGGAGLLTGPMFSHLIGNLVFRQIDEELAAHTSVRYFRYVDDVALVGSAGDVQAMEQRLTARLDGLGLALNSTKRLEVPCHEWLQGRGDFTDPPGPSWKSFIGGMKQLLLFDAGAREPLQALFQAHGIRIRPLDYSQVAQERRFLQRLVELASRRWFRAQARQRDLTQIVQQGLWLRQQYTDSLSRWLDLFPRLEGFQRKRALYRLRFLTARLLYLAPLESLKEWGDATAGIPEMAMISTLFTSLHEGDVTPLLRFGSAAAQSAAQALRGLNRGVRCAPPEWREETVQAYAVLRLNGVPLEDLPSLPPSSPLVQFCEWGGEATSLWSCEDEYFRELGCVHGADNPDLNAWAVDTAFDRDDDMVFEIQDLMQGSS